MPVQKGESAWGGQVLGRDKKVFNKQFYSA